MPDSSPRILIFDENEIRASILREGLEEAGFREVMVVSEISGLVARIAEFDPDAIFMDLESPNRDRLENMLEVTRSIARPIAMFVDESDSQIVERAIDSGVSAYIVDGLKKERVKSILDITISRFNAFHRLQTELDQVKGELADRKAIEQAKLVLMKRQAIPEDEAYALLRRTAMSNNCRIADVARSILLTADLLNSDKK